jgi:AraC-like DNA-binding protein
MEFIRKAYRPLQPAVKTHNREVVYEELYPTSMLNKYVYCFWQLYTPVPLATPFVYRVVSDGCIDIYVNRHTPNESFVMGFCRKCTEFPIGHNFHYVGIRFLPGCFPLLFGIDAQTLSNREQPLTKVLPEVASWLQQAMQPALDWKTVSLRLETHLETLIASARVPDSRFCKALDKIFQNKGVVDVEKDLEVGLSPRQLQRLFNHYLGTTPKAFSNVVRFQHILNSVPSLEALQESRAYFDAGFYDQAHFIRQFKTFYGVTPSQAFG